MAKDAEITERLECIEEIIDQLNIVNVIVTKERPSTRRRYD